LPAIRAPAAHLWSLFASWPVLTLVLCGCTGPIRSRLDKKKNKRGKSDASNGPGGVKLPIGKQKAIKRLKDRKRKEIEERGKPVSAREARRRGAKALSAKLNAGKPKMKGIKRAKSAGLVKAKKKTVKF
jgi:hypothetical protein